jgi:hypothetical protein
MNESLSEIQELWTFVVEGAIHHMTPEELEEFAAGEQAEADARKALDKLAEQVRPRQRAIKMNAYADSIVAQLSPEARELVRKMYPQEIVQFTDLTVQENEGIERQVRVCQKTSERLGSPPEGSVEMGRIVRKCLIAARKENAKIVARIKAKYPTYTLTDDLILDTYRRGGFPL